MRWGEIGGHHFMILFHKRNLLGVHIGISTSRKLLLHDRMHPRGGNAMFEATSLKRRCVHLQITQCKTVTINKWHHVSLYAHFFHQKTMCFHPLQLSNDNAWPPTSMIKWQHVYAHFNHEMTMRVLCLYSLFQPSLVVSYLSYRSKQATRPYSFSLL